MINVVWARSGPFFPNHRALAAVCVASGGVVVIKTNSNLMQQVEFDRSILAGSWIASVNQETIFAVDLNF